MKELHYFLMNVINLILNNLFQQKVQKNKKKKWGEGKDCFPLCRIKIDFKEFEKK